MEQDKLNKLFKDEFASFEMKPSNSAWAALSKKLWWLKFWKFSLQTVNIYWASLLLLVFSGSLYAIYSNDNKPQELGQKEHIYQSNSNTDLGNDVFDPEEDIKTNACKNRTTSTDDVDELASTNIKDSEQELNTKESNQSKKNIKANTKAADQHQLAMNNKAHTNENNVNSTAAISSKSNTSTTAARTSSNTEEDNQSVQQDLASKSIDSEAIKTNSSLNSTEHQGTNIQATNKTTLDKKQSANALNTKELARQENQSINNTTESPEIHPLNETVYDTIRVYDTIPVYETIIKENPDTKNPKSNWNFNTYIGTQSSSLNYTSENAIMQNTLNAASSPILGYTVGAMVGYQINKLNIASGFEYNQINETFSFAAANSDLINEFWIYQPSGTFTFHDTVAYIPVYDPETQTYIETPVINDSTIQLFDSTLIKNLKTEYTNSYSYVSIPLMFGYDIVKNNGLTISAKAGGVLGFRLNAKGKSLTFNEADELWMMNLDDAEVPFADIALNWQIGIGIAYRINKHYQIIIDPYYRKNLSSLYDDNYQLNSKIGLFGLNAGIKYEF